jgi:L-methionine (R)-S-oxide reductase
VKGGELVLGPFQGPIACTRIKFDQGVCGHAYTTRETVIVPDVEAFPGHIACASASRSEIVVPIFRKDGQVFGVLDVDSDKLDDLTSVDAAGLERIVRSLETTLAVA